ncbi:hypothetical protein, partial [Actinomadura kijaniata]|uniref:hypothetical protein n=1 Tax=Actinomadura kijaniata TaxID=46161 RepID=UPI001C3F449A
MAAQGLSAPTIPQGSGGSSLPADGATGAVHADDLPPTRARRVRAALVAGHAAGAAGADAAAA